MTKHSQTSMWKDLSIEAIMTLKSLGLRLPKIVEEAKIAEQPIESELSQPLLSNKQKITGYFVSMNFFDRLQRFYAEEVIDDGTSNRIKMELRDFFKKRPHIFQDIAKVQLKTLKAFWERELKESKADWESLNRVYRYRVGEEIKTINPSVMLHGVQTLIDVALTQDHESKVVGNHLTFSRVIKESYSPVPKEVISNIILKPSDEEIYETKQAAGLTCMSASVGGCTSGLIVGGGTITGLVSALSFGIGILVCLVGLAIFGSIYKSKEKATQDAKNKTDKLMASISVSHWLIRQPQNRPQALSSLANEMK